MTNDYYKSFNKFWTPIYKKMFFKAKVKNDNELINAIHKNVFDNWNLNNEQKQKIWNEIIGGKNGNNYKQSCC